MFQTGAAMPQREYDFGPLAPEQRQRPFTPSAEDLGQLMLDPRPTAVAAIVYSLWFTIVGLVLALFTGSSPWQEIGFAMLIVFGACAATGLAHAVPRALKSCRRRRLLGRA
jgi:hypothetical protein